MDQVQSKSNARRKKLSNILILHGKTIEKGIAAFGNNNNFVIKGKVILQQCAVIGIQLQKCT
jgi:hypothetical protein